MSGKSGLTDFEALLLRYFEGDLDMVERHRLEQLKEASPQNKARFWAVYDERVAAMGFFAIAPGDPELESCFSLDTLEAFQRGELDEEEAGWVRAHRCPLCEAQLQSMAPPKRERQRPPRWARRRAVIGALALLAALLLLIILVPHPKEPKFTPKGPPVTWDDLVGIEVRRGVEGPLAEGDAMSPQDRLQFFVTNQGEPLYLSVFAVDVQGDVFWYYPGWLDARDNPASIRLQAQSARRLDEEVEHALPSGPLVIVALFTKDRRRVREIEATLGERGAGQLDLEVLRTLFPEAAVRRLPLQVR